MLSTSSVITCSPLLSTLDDADQESQFTSQSNPLYLGTALSCQSVLFILKKTFIDIFAIPRNISCLRGVGASWRLEHPLVSSHLSDDQLMLIKSEVAT